MKTGKVSEAVLKRSVIKPVNKHLKKYGIAVAGVGVDAGLFAVPADTAAMGQAGTIVAGNQRGVAELAICRACNSLAAAGGKPVFVTVQLMLPETMEESGLKETMEEILTACERAGVVLKNGHTQVSTLVTERVIAVTVTGRVPETAWLNETVAGSELVMAGSAGLAGAALLAAQFREELHEKYTYAFIDKAVGHRQEMLVSAVAEKLLQHGVVHMHDVAEGGVFGAAWEFAERLSCGMEIDLKKIPILQETVEVSEFFDINPYQLKGDGALLFLSGNAAESIALLGEHGIAAAVIGRVTDGNDRILINEDEIRHLEPNRVEEYERALQFMKQGKENSYERKIIKGN